MKQKKELNKIFKVLQNHEKRIAALEGKKISDKKGKTKAWYKSGSTTEKIVMLIEQKFFDKPHSISETISELKTKDYHLKASDLTLPLRRVVRKGLLKKTRKRTDGSQSKTWLYIKI